ncbi:MBL fold metallo-hydrolase [Stenotrophomonas sp.]|uniref:MBL fold metallo-hydrolase n=1 Tax=Stenotrophomonas sp. TaxID=69392 RepID=UPI00289A2F53|nr:MBL fold metallo-hydrolase [Stenotrophomonas sp.]
MIVARALRKAAIVGAALVLVAAAVVVAFLQHPQFGRLPSGNALHQLEASRHYWDGIFHNEVDTTIDTDPGTGFVASDGKARRPATQIPAVKTSIKDLDPNADLVIWLGHSSYYVQLAGKRILIDPVFTDNASPVWHTNNSFAGTNIYSADDFPEIDYLLISHDHYDHLDYPTVKSLMPKVRHVVAGLGVGSYFRGWGYPADKVVDADWRQIIAADDLEIVVTPARHYSGRLFEKNKTLWVGYVVKSKSRRLFFSGDSGYGPHFAEIGKQYGPFDWVALDDGQYDRRWANVHMNAEQAGQAADDLHAAAFTPGHVGRFSLAPHAWDEPLEQSEVEAKRRHYALWTPAIGSPMYLDGRSQKFGTWWRAPGHVPAPTEASFN